MYYNRYLSSCYERSLKGKPSYKDLYLYDFYSPSKVYTGVAFLHKVSYFDYILSSYKYTRDNKLAFFTLSLSSSDVSSLYLKLFLGLLHKLNIKVFSFTSLDLFDEFILKYNELDLTYCCYICEFDRDNLKVVCHENK